MAIRYLDKGGNLKTGMDRDFGKPVAAKERVVVDKPKDIHEAKQRVEAAEKSKKPAKSRPKKLVNIRIAGDIFDWFEDRSDNWRAEMEEALREYIERNKK